MRHYLMALALLPAGINSARAADETPKAAVDALVKAGVTFYRSKGDDGKTFITLSAVGDKIADDVRTRS